MMANRSFSSISVSTRYVPMVNLASRKMPVKLPRLQFIGAKQRVRVTTQQKARVQVTDNLVELMLAFKRQDFDRSFNESGERLRVNVLMRDCFVLGPAFSANLIRQDLVKEVDYTLKTPLHYAAAGGVDLQNPAIQSRLVKPLVGQQDDSGITALMIAAVRGDLMNVQALGVEAELLDSQGRSAMWYAKRGAVQVLLKQLGCPDSAQ